MSFAKQIIDWQKKFGRHNLPWQINPNPYRILLSEIMLQQTQVTTVIPFFINFTQRFPSIERLAQASSDDVMASWAGLGYYRRAHNLHSLAKIVTVKYKGHLPSDAKTLASLPGIGRSTAAAIACFAFNAHEPILDGNVKRILCRAFSISGQTTKKSTEATLWKLAESLMPHQDLSASRYAQGLMDLGAIICKKNNPTCHACPIKLNCNAFLTHSQDSFPEKIKRKKIPLEEKTLVLAYSTQSIALQRRQENGIWGGLWSLPETKELCATDPLNNFLKQLPENEKVHLPPILHKFTHFQLKIKTIAVSHPLNSQTIEDQSLENVKWQEIKKYGLPSPIKLILSNFYRTFISEKTTNSLH